jgi:hypothetical protein
MRHWSRRSAGLSLRNSTPILPHRNGIYPVISKNTPPIYGRHGTYHTSYTFAQGRSMGLCRRIEVCVGNSRATYVTSGSDFYTYDATSGLTTVLSRVMPLQTNPISRKCSRRLQINIDASVLYIVRGNIPQIIALYRCVPKTNFSIYISCDRGPLVWSRYATDVSDSLNSMPLFLLDLRDRRVKPVRRCIYGLEYAQLRSHLKTRPP